MINVGPGRRMTTAEAAARLGVKPQTLYAYVSRGLLRREHSEAGSLFDPQEVERLAARSRGGAPGGRSPANLAFVTELTLIEDGRLWYRGEDAVELSRSRRYEDVAEWLWSDEWSSLGEPWRASEEATEVVRAAVSGLDSSPRGPLGPGSPLKGPLGPGSPLRGPLGPGVLPSDRFKVAVAAAATVDLWRHHLAPDAVRAAGKTIVGAMLAALPPAYRSRGPRPVASPVRDPRQPKSAALSGPVADQLWPRLSPLPATPERVAALDAALVLLADHELAASTLAARVAAAFGADPYAVVSTGLGAASGALHAANSTAVVELLEDALGRPPAEAVADRLGREQSLAGFGQVLYPEGDPRGRELLRRAAELVQPEDRGAVVEEVAQVAAWRGLPPPSVDFALAALAFGQRMVPGAGEAIFILARSAGWLAHAMEEYSSRTTFRVRASYVGRR